MALICAPLFIVFFITNVRTVSLILGYWGFIDLSEWSSYLTERRFLATCLDIIFYDNLKWVTLDFVQHEVQMVPWTKPKAQIVFIHEHSERAHLCQGNSPLLYMLFHLKLAFQSPSDLHIVCFCEHVAKLGILSLILLGVNSWILKLNHLLLWSNTRLDKIKRKSVHHFPRCRTKTMILPPWWT